MKAFIFSLFLSLILINVQAQERKFITVRGTVFSTEGRKPLSNVSIHYNGGATKSGQNGAFAIGVRSLTDTLLFSSVGYWDKRELVNRVISESVIYLNRKVNVLEDVVVQTGYQTLKANEITGSVDVISNEMLNQQTGGNILDRLKNITPAIRFDNKPTNDGALQKLNMSVRGLSTINGQRDPLIVLDGFIYDGNIENIDANSIDNVTVLKDAAAAAIWGARAGNGVIVISSKKGSFYLAQPKVSFSSTLLLPQNLDLNRLYQLSNREFIDIEKMLFEQGYYNLYLDYVPYYSMTPAVDLFDRRKRGLISAADSTSMMNQMLAQNGPQNYMDRFYHRSYSDQHSLNVRGGGGRNAYSFGVGHNRNRAINDAHNDKLNINMSNSYKPTDKLRLDINVLFTNQKSTAGLPGYNSLTYGTKVVPYMNFLDEQDKELPFENGYRKSYMDSAYPKGYLDWGYYPLSEYKQATNNTNIREYNSSVNLNYQLFSFLDANVAFQLANQQEEYIQLNSLDSYAARSLINSFSVYDASTNTTKYNVPLGGIKNNNRNSGMSKTFRAQLNFNKKIKDYHIIGMVGAERRAYDNDYSSYSMYGYNKLPATSVPVDYVNAFLSIPVNYPMNIAGSPIAFTESNRFVSIYTNWSGIWKDKYSVSGSLRRDGANIFGANTNEKWSPLWSVGGAWLLSKENFLKFDWLDSWRMRATYGYSGNVDIRKTPDPIAGAMTARYTNLPALNLNALNDPSLRWEKVSTLNFGMDFSLWQGRLTGALDYYIKNGTDLYGPAEYDYTNWGKAITVIKNVASMQGRGLDLNLNAVIINSTFKWNTRTILSLNRNKTTAYYLNTVTKINAFVTDGNYMSPFVGKPLYALAGYTWMGLDEQGRAQGNLNGNPSTDYVAIRNDVIKNGENSAGIRFFGSSKPQAYGNWINTFSYQNVDLIVNVNYMGDYYFRKPTTRASSLFSKGIAYPDYDDRWQVVGDEARTNVPAMFYPTSSSAEPFYENADFNILRADHIRLAYISASWNKRWQMGNKSLNTRLFLNASNLGIIWTKNKVNIDPEFPYQLGSARTYSIGIQVDY
ncbi:SusC/RagA family TonB-linked outer membrane protein [Sphingobacterium sp. SG20118]|uniref:SusC/RagA family TonB-linked outer membrane protein n=1 Tax=Sphingobacterium sp. SG20118 TaxID=3367156 RepID=UPI0037DFC6F3